MSILTRPLVYDDLLQVPDDNKRYEIIGGELHVTPAPTPEHQRFSRRLVAWLTEHVEPRKLGEVFPAPLDVVLGEHEIVQPDIVFVSTRHRHIVGPQRITGTPDLVVEILSDSTRIRDEVIKAALYARSGVPELWIIDPLQRAIRVYTLRDHQYILDASSDGYAHSTLLPGFRVSIAALFADFS